MPPSNPSNPTADALAAYQAAIADMEAALADADAAATAEQEIINAMARTIHTPAWHEHKARWHEANALGDAAQQRLIEKSVAVDTAKVELERDLAERHRLTLDMITAYWLALNRADRN